MTLEIVLSLKLNRKMWKREDIGAIYRATNTRNQQQETPTSGPVEWETKPSSGLVQWDHT